MENLKSCVKMRANTKYMTCKIPISFVHSFVALQVEGGEQKASSEEKYRMCFCVPDSSTLRECR